MSISIIDLAFVLILFDLPESENYNKEFLSLIYKKDKGSAIGEEINHKFTFKLISQRFPA